MLDCVTVGGEIFEVASSVVVGVVVEVMGVLTGFWLGDLPVHADCDLFAVFPDNPCRIIEVSRSQDPPAISGKPLVIVHVYDCKAGWLQRDQRKRTFDRIRLSLG